MNNLNKKQGHFMPAVNVKNEKAKHKYYDYLKEAQGFSQKSIEAIQKAIYRYEEFTNGEDFAGFNSEKAKEFKKWLESKKNPINNTQISISTNYTYLRYLKNFFKWLCYQPSYKSKISMNDVEYLKLDKQKSRIATSSRREKFPTIEQLKKVINSIEIKTEIDMRDRALLCFTFLSGMRDNAIVSLPIGCFDVEALQISQDPKKGVKTKFSKTIYSYLFKFDDEMLGYILDWIKYLKEEKFFGNADPIFPMNKVEFAYNSKSFTSNKVEPSYWHGANPMREVFRQRFKEADVEYFPPHSFRHLATNYAEKRCRNAEELKAISQNLGHENVGTTFGSYGNINNNRVGELITQMDFSDSNDAEERALFEQFKALMRKKI